MTQQLAVRPDRTDPGTGPAPAPDRRRHSPRLVAAVALVLLVASAVTYGATSAAFTASTSTGTNTFTAGTVALTNSSSGSALFAVGSLTPGDGGSRCVTVDYTGDIDAGIRLYGTATGALATHLELVVQESTTPTPPDCSGFTPGATIVNGSMSAALATFNSYATGAGTWAVTGPASRSYQVRYALPSGASNTAQGTSANMTLTWEAQS